jgi:hypothetical protein
VVILVMIMAGLVGFGGYLVGARVTVAQATQTVNDQASKSYNDGYSHGYFQGYAQGKLYAHVNTSSPAVAQPSDKTDWAYMWVENDYGVKNVFFGSVPSGVDPFNFVLAPGVSTAFKTCMQYVVKIDYTTGQITTVNPVPATTNIPPLPTWSSCVTH